MRLIDADELYEDLANNLSSIMGDGSDGEAIDTYVTIGNIIHDTFNAQPTAYDPDKVVEQLENERKFWEYAYDKDLGKEKARSYAHAIEIVKGGGADGN
nr:MAG TPA: hypothetical protein [Caudoviricetes sp.]